MRAALAVAPRWAQSVAIGVYFGLLFALTYRAWGENWASGLFVASLGSVIFGGSAYRVGLAETESYARPCSLSSWHSVASPFGPPRSGPRRSSRAGRRA